MQNYVTFKKYPDAAQAKEIEQLLLTNNIQCLLVDNASSLDGSFGGMAIKDYEIKLQPQDFAAAEQLLLAYADEWTSNVPDNYYLLTFTDEELYEVLQKKDEWSEFDYVLAQKLLSERGKSIDAQSLKQLEAERMLALAWPDDLHFGWIIAGYVFALLGGLFGIITGYLIYTAKKTLLNGTKVHSYSQGRRAHAKNILIIGCIVVAISGSLRILGAMER
ncbi:MAG: hypothetical protein V4581_14540 [Bacteroidota bacterium]